MGNTFNSRRNSVPSFYKIIVGIDFGTSGIGYAYSFNNNQNQILLSNFEGQLSDKKVPSEIILDNDLNNILAFGNKCKGYIISHEKNTYEYFKNIKMNLYNKTYKIKSTNGREVDIELIITKILIEVSEQVISQLKENHDNNFEKKDIKWVVTIPAIWDEKSKAVMINASKAAKLIDDNTDQSLFLALEPEAAGIFYFSNISLINETTINEGKPYIICDIGAGTVDICTHRKIINKIKTPQNSSSKNQTIFDSELIEEYPPIGGDYGGNFINLEFIKRVIIEVFGEENVKKLKNNLKNENWDEFEEKIEKLKRKFDENLPADFRLDCNIFKSYSNGKTLDDYISEYNKKGHKFRLFRNYKSDNEWELSFPSKIFSEITKEITKKKIKKIEEIYNNVHTGTIILTGAGSKNTNIVQFLYNLAKEKKIEINIRATAEPEVAIMKGAVLFALNNSIIRKRKSKYTIGIKVSRDWNEKLHKKKGIKKYNNFKKKFQCTNLFSKFFTINEYIEFDKIISHTYDSISSKPTIIFYRTSKKNCVFIDEKDENDNLIIEKFGEIDFEIGNDYDINNREVKIDMKLGGTYIYMSAIYLKNNKRIKIIQNFV